MEETTKQITQKPPLPIKTKIAVWWMIVLGVLLTILHFYFYFHPGLGLSLGGESGLIYVGIFYFIVSGLLLIKNKWAWWLVFLLMSYGAFYEFISLFLFSLPFLIPYILLIIDCGNYWKIAS